MRPFFALLTLGLLVLGIFPLTVAAANSCNDIDITPTNVTFQEDKDGKSISFTIENEGDDTFEIDDVVLEENSQHFELSLDDFSDEVDSEDDGKISIEYDTLDVNADQEDDFQIKIKGEFDDDDNKQCSFSSLSFTIDVTIEDGEAICGLIVVEADDVDIAENDTITHSITVENDSDEDFFIQDFDVFDDSPNFNTQLDPEFDDSDFDDVIPANSTVTYNLEIDSDSVDDDETDTVFVEIRGEFEDGDDCSFSDISEEFEVTVEDSGTDSSVCADITLDTPMIFIQGNETIVDALTLANNSAQNFFVDEFTITDKNYQLSFETLSIPDKVKFGESDLVTFEATGYGYPTSFDGNAFLSMKGHFTSGSTCFVSTKKLSFHYEGTQGDTCDEFYSNLPTVTILKGVSTHDVFLNNPSNYPATITFSLTQGQVSPYVVHVPGNTATTQTLFFTNVEENQTLTLNAQIPGCDAYTQTSALLFSGLDDAPVQFVDPPAVLTLGNAKEFALSVKNKSAYAQDVQITLIPKPGTQTFSHTTLIPGLDEPLIYLPTNILQGKSSVIIQMKSAGYIVTHTAQLNQATGIQVETETVQGPSIQNTYTIDVTVTNPTPQAVEGEVVVDVPSTWNISGNPNLNMAPFSTETLTLTITPDKVLSNAFQGHVYFNGSPHSSAGKNILFQAPSNPISATALAVGSSGLWAGILVMLLLVGAWYVTKPKITITKAVFMSPAQKGSEKETHEDMEEEPWMHPSKE
jgi:hypothetical protein